MTTNPLLQSPRSRFAAACLFAVTTAAITACSTAPDHANARSNAADLILIRELLDRHQLYIDLADPALYASLFTPDASYESFFASASGRSEIESISRALHESGFTANKRHYSGPAMIDLDGDRAEVRSYWWVLDTEGTPRVFASGTYEDQLNRESGEWLIARRVLVSDQSADTTGL